jgi:hypothetical protein
MKFDIKKMYHETVKQLEKHQVEIEIALAALAVVALVPEEAEVLAAKEALKLMYEEVLNVTKKHIKAINDILDADPAEDEVPQA